jgi:hypothetical protein
MRMRTLSEAMEREFAKNRQILDQAQEAAAAALAIFECTKPAGGLGPGTHCAACCYGTGYVVTCEEEDELVRALSTVKSALEKYAGGDT